MKLTTKVFDAKTLCKMQDSAIRGLTKSKENMQQVLISTLIHVWKHGDRMPAARMLEAMQKGTSKAEKADCAKVQAFLETYGGLIYQEKDHLGNDLKTFMGWRGPEHIQRNFEEAKVTMWWTLHKQDKTEKVFDINQAIASLAKRIADNKDKQGAVLTLNRESVQTMFTITGLVETLEPASLAALFDAVGIESALADNEQELSDAETAERLAAYMEREDKEAA